MAGYSIPASEHSTMTTWGRSHEEDAMLNILELYPYGVVACVSDSYDIFNACEHIWGEKLKSQIMSRNGTLVVRPDSGNPVEIIMRLLHILGEKFGFSTNDKGYYVLDPHIRIIQSDSLDSETITKILDTMKAAGWSIDNIIFGMGGALLQHINRDTYNFALKCSAARVKGVWRDVWKDPITSSSKKSKAGRLKLVQNSRGEYRTITTGEQGKDILVPVFENGKILREDTLEEIRKRLGF